MKTNHTWCSLSLASLFALAACGGDGGSASPPPPPPPPAPAVLTVVGTAAPGAAIAGGAGEVKCAPGTGSATTSTSGTFSAGVSGGVLPCVLRVTSGTTVLHSIVASGGSSVTANITPLTELLAASIAAGTPDAMFTTFDATAQARVTTTAITNAIATALAALKGTLDLTGVDPIGGTLVAANGSTAGNSLDVLLDQLAAALAASKSTLADLAAVVATSTPDSAPVLRQIAPHATTCAALRSGDYVVLNPHETIDEAAFSAYHLNIDATTLLVTDVEPGHEPDSATLAPVDGQPCSVTYDGEFGTETALVSPGGVIVVRSPSKTGPTRTSLIVPAQKAALADLAGTWDYLAYARQPGGVLMPFNGVRTLDAVGGATGGTSCTGLSCETDGAQPNLFTVDANGGFDVADDGVAERAFAYVTDSGAMSIYVLLPNEGGLIVMTRQVPLSLPAVDSSSNFWDFTVGNGAFSWEPVNGATALASSTISVTAVDQGAQTYTRLRAADQRVDVLSINSPVEGMRQRTASGNLSGTILLPITGTGMVFYTSVAANQNFLGISVDQP